MISIAIVLHKKDGSIIIRPDLDNKFKRNLGSVLTGYINEYNPRFKSRDQETKFIKNLKKDILLLFDNKINPRNKIIFENKNEK